MEINQNNIKEKINHMRIDCEEEIKGILAAEKLSKFIINLPYIKQTKSGNVEIYTYSQAYGAKGALSIKIEDINLSDFVENVLGVIHRWKHVDWVMDIQGDSNDPVFVFKVRNINYYTDKLIDNVMLYFNVKEGRFKSCTVEKIVIGEDISHHVQPKYKYEMRCM